MANITRFDPFSATRFEPFSDFDDLFKGLFKKESEEKKDEEVVRSERYYGKVSRSFTLPHDIDEAKVAAKYADGVLKLTLPAKARSASKKIAVN